MNWAGKGVQKEPKFIQVSNCEGDWTLAQAKMGWALQRGGSTEVCGRAWFHMAYLVCSHIYRALKYGPGIVQGSGPEE